MNLYIDRISDIFTSEYSDFLEYCTLAGKEYAHELTPTDYVAFRTQYGWSREAIEKIRTQITNCITHNDDPGVTETVFNPQVSGESAASELLEKSDSHPQRGKEPSVPKKTNIDFSDTPFYIHFGVDPAKYANIPIEAVSLNARSLGILKRGQIYTVEQLLSSSSAEIFGFRQSGRESVAHIIARLNEYLSDSSENTDVSIGKSVKKNEKSPLGFHIREMFTEAVQEMLHGTPYDVLSLTEDEKNYIGRCILAKEVIGEEACLLALENPKSVIPVMSCLLKFSENTSQKIKFLGNVRDEITKLPPTRRKKRLSPYLQYRIDQYPHMKTFAAQIPQETDIQGILPFFDTFWNQSGEISPEEQKETILFLQWLNYDFLSLVQALQETLQRQGRGQYVIEERAKGATLEQIASPIGLTRERIRQIEHKVVRSLIHTLTHGKYKLIHLIYLETGGKDILRLPDIETYLGDDIARIVWYIVKRGELKSKNYRYDSGLDALIFSGHANSEKLEKALKSMPDVFFEGEMENLIKDAADRYGLSVDLLREHLLRLYHIDGVCYHKDRLTIVQMCLYVLKERFQNGYKIADELDQKRFLSALKEVFGSQGTTTARALDAKIGSIGVLCDRGKYIHPDYAEAPQALIDGINQYIENSPRTVLPYAEIYQAFSDRFFGTRISNRYALQGALKKYGCPFILRKDYVTKDRSMSMTEEFNRFVKSKGEVYKSEIFEEFTAFSDANIMFLLNRCPEIISLDNGHYMHASCLSCSEGERVKMAAYLKNACYPIPVSTRSLLNDFTLHFTNFMSRNHIDTPGKLFGILQYLFKDQFHFSRPYVSLEDMGVITRRGVILRLLDDCESIEINDLLQMCEENGTLIHSATDLIQMVQPDFLRISENILIRRDLTGLTEEVIEEAVQNIQEAVRGNNGYFAAKNITDYSWYPLIQVEWNPFVLESVAALAGNALPTLRIPSSLADAPPLTIFTGEQYADDDLNSLIVKVLSEEHRKEPFRTQSEVLRWLQEQGLCNAKLPDFLTKEGYLFIDENGRLQVTEYGKNETDAAYGYG